jgi:predicted lipid-binding transport protein (Tim44 family)
LLLRTFARSRTAAQPALQTAGGAAVAPREPRLGSPAPVSIPQPAGKPARRVPADFDEPAFLEQARKAFVRLQGANDAGDLNAIRDFTTPEFFTTLEAQIRSRDGAPQKVNVTTLDAELLEVATEGEFAVASVLFSGFIRESADGLAERFEEIWHVVKDLSDPKSSWLLAGIQQVA